MELCDFDFRYLLVNLLKPFKKTLNIGFKHFFILFRFLNVTQKKQKKDKQKIIKFQGIQIIYIFIFNFFDV